MCSKLTAHGEKLRGEREGRKEEEEEWRRATGISFYGNHHLAHGNKLPALLKQREMGGVVVVVVVVRCGFRAKDRKHHSVNAVSPFELLVKISILDLSLSLFPSPPSPLL